ncbi:hypothetical protein WDZ92_01260, partial [Nostoc sp. NIES-2111]
RLVPVAEYDLDLAVEAPVIQNRQSVGTSFILPSVSKVGVASSPLTLFPYPAPNQLADDRSDVGVRTLNGSSLTGWVLKQKTLVLSPDGEALTVTDPTQVVEGSLSTCRGTYHLQRMPSIEAKGYDFATYCFEDYENRFDVKEIDRYTGHSGTVSLLFDAIGFNNNTYMKANLIYLKPAFDKSVPGKISHVIRVWVKPDASMAVDWVPDLRYTVRYINSSAIDLTPNSSGIVSLDMNALLPSPVASFDVDATPSPGTGRSIIAKVGDWTLVEYRIQGDVSSSLDPDRFWVDIGFKMVSGKKYRIDDFRVEPMIGTMTAKLYDGQGKISHIFDDQHFASQYQYLPDGTLVRIKKETERDWLTIKESVRQVPKLPKGL